MVLRKDCMELILKQVPSFSDAWQAHLDYWGDEVPGLCNDMTAFSRYVTDLLNSSEQVENLAEIFNLIEYLLINGDQVVGDAVATCFLENLINVSSTEKLDSRKFVSFLGPESRAYCQAWDDFTGVHTDGL